MTYVSVYFCFLSMPRQPRSTLFPYTTLFRSYGIDIQQIQPAMFRLFTSGDLVDWAKLTTLGAPARRGRSEEHTSELQSRFDLVCRLLLEKKKPPTCAPISAVFASRRISSWAT